MFLVVPTRLVLEKPFLVHKWNEPLSRVFLHRRLVKSKVLSYLYFAKMYSEKVLCLGHFSEEFGGQWCGECCDFRVDCGLDFGFFYELMKFYGGFRVVTIICCSFVGDEMT